VEYRYLTGTGVKVSRLCLGAMTFGAQVEQAEANRMIHAALDSGINIIDTADVYNQGRSEQIVGEALVGRRERVVLVSKVRGRAGADPYKDEGLHRWHILRGVEASLKRLQTDCLDVLFLHRPDNNTPLEETLAAVDQLQRQGKIIYYGMSNYAAWQVSEARWLADRFRFQRPAVTQVPYNVLTRGIESELIPFCRAKNVGITVYNPLAGGLLTGKHAPSEPPASGTRFQLNQQYHDRYWREANFEAVSELQTIAGEVGMTLVQLAFQWLMAQKPVDTIILGASRMEQLAENIRAADGQLDEETLRACGAVWERIKGPSFQYNR
jgi:aryl-alcohol dehydrogenase-like predicted oxidoreductase